VDGRVLARKVQADSRLAATRVVLLQAVRDHRPAGFQIPGVAATLVKPVPAAQLFEAISRLLRAEAAEPLRVASLGSGRSAAERRSAMTSRPILVVEDNPVNQQVACGWLHKLGYRADVAANGFEALEALERIPYAAVLMDCQMPEMDGYEATAELRRREGATTHTPVIAMTASVMYGDRERCLEAGMDEYVPKPVRLEDLDAALRRWLPAGDTHNALIEPVLLRRLEQLHHAGNTGELANRITIFLEDTPRLLRLMHYAAAHQDGGALVQVARALRGAASHLGLSELVGVCERLERLVRAGNVGRAAELVADVDQACARARQPLEALRGQPEWLTPEADAAEGAEVSDNCA
jgi:CheY-like chemotaxis protein/HPt (histidine-containing phosphotransfer) domain-containing protein